MPGAALECGEALAAGFEAYHAATLALVEALRNADEAAVPPAVALRARCLEALSPLAKRWESVPPGERPPDLVEKLKWHRNRMGEAEGEALRLAQALRDQIGGEIARFGANRKKHQAYASTAGKPIRILEGEG